MIYVRSAVTEALFEASAYKSRHPYPNESVLKIVCERRSKSELINQGESLANELGITFKID